MKIINIVKSEELLKKSGYICYEFEFVTKGKYSIHDGKWNYMDVQHTNYVHSKVESERTLISNDFINSIHLQNIIGIKFPMTLTQYEVENKLIYYSTLFVFLLIVETNFTRDELTEVKTKYKIYGPRWSKPIMYLLKFISKKNYETLMKEDIPLRNRKHYLRDLGYTFSHDNQKLGWLYLDNLHNNLIIPLNFDFNSYSINLLDVPHGESFYGNNIHSGIRILRKDDFFSIYDRICYHEGACIDSKKVIGNYIECPWHGKKSYSIVDFTLNQDNFSIERSNKKFIKDKTHLIISK